MAKIKDACRYIQGTIAQVENLGKYLGVVRANGSYRIKYEKAEFLFDERKGALYRVY